MSESNMQVSSGSIFVCYRREDSADVTGRVYDRLIDHFGRERVFMDVEAIRLGYDFRSEIDQTIKVCSIVIVVIGDKWLAEVDGKRRIDDENDRVRIEIEAALRREIPIIPILARGASHPTKVMLPPSLEALAYRHGTSIRHEHFRGDVDFLISQMDTLLARRESTPSKPAQSKEPQETEPDATSTAAPVSLRETTPQVPTRAAPPQWDSGTERRQQQDSVASVKDPRPPEKSTQTTQSQLAIPPVSSIPAITALEEPTVWRRKRLIVAAVAAVGVAVVLLLGIPRQLTTPNKDARHTLVQADIQAIKTQLQLYESMTGYYPTAEMGLQALVTPFFHATNAAATTTLETGPTPTRWYQLLRKLPKDPWQNDYIYLNPGLKNPNGYDLYSAGPDRKPDTADDDWGGG